MHLAAWDEYVCSVFWFENHWGHKIIIILWSWKQHTAHWRNFGFRLSMSSVLVSLQARGVVKTTGAESKNYLRIDYFSSAQQTSLAEMQSTRMTSKKWFQHPDCYSFNIVQATAFWNHFFFFFFFSSLFYTQFEFYRRAHFLYDLFQRKREKKCPTVPLNKLTLGECENCTMDLKQFTFFCCVIIKLVKVCFLTFSVYSVCLCKCVCGWVSVK